VFPYIFVTVPLIVFLSIIGYLTMTANGGTVEYFDTFNDDRRRRRRRRRKHRRQQRSGKSCKKHNATVKDEIS
jgi:transposase